MKMRIDDNDSWSYWSLEVDGTSIVKHPGGSAGPADWAARFWLSGDGIAASGMKVQEFDL